MTKTKPSKKNATPFYTAFEEKLNSFVPLRPVSKNKMKRMKNPWIGKKLLNMMREKNRSYRKFLRKKSDKHYKQYKKLRNKVNRERKCSKEKYYNNLFQNSTNSRSMWRSINKLINLKTPKDNNIKELIEENGSIKTNNDDISNLLNESFTQAGAKISSKIEEPDQTRKEKMKQLIRPVSNSIYLYPITTIELNSFIKTLEVNKSTPSNCAPIWIF